MQVELRLLKHESLSLHLPEDSHDQNWEYLAHANPNMGQIMLYLRYT